MAPPPPPPRKGVDLRLGRDMGLRIDCGDEPMERCLAAAKPLLDKVPNLTIAPPRADGMEPTPAGDMAPPPVTGGANAPAKPRP